jgi:hypothetical protein
MDITLLGFVLGGVVIGIVIALACGMVSHVICEHCRKECSICWAKVEDYEDENGSFYALHHGDGWVETITVPAKGKRPEVVIHLLSGDLSDEGVTSYALIRNQD